MKRLLLLVFLFAPCLAQAATISFTIAVTGNPDVAKTYTLSDSDAALLVPAYQQGANTMVNGVATRTQVLRYMIQTWIDAMKQTVTAYQTQAQLNALPPIVPINPQ